MTITKYKVVGSNLSRAELEAAGLIGDSYSPSGDYDFTTVDFIDIGDEDSADNTYYVFSHKAIAFFTGREDSRFITEAMAYFDA